MYIVCGFVSLLMACDSDITPDGGSVGNNAASAKSIVSSGTKESYDPIQYTQWMLDQANGMRKEKEMDDLVFTLQYETPQFIACREERKEEMSCEVLKRKNSELEGMIYFSFNISLTSGSGELLKYKLNSYEQFDERVKYYSFRMDKDVMLVNNNDTVPCGLYHFERTYEVAPKCVFNLGFDAARMKFNYPITFLFEDKIFEKGIIKFTYTPDSFKKIPKLTCS